MTLIVILISYTLYDNNCVYDSKEEMVISATKNGKLNKGKPKNKHKKGVDMDE